MANPEHLSKLNHMVTEWNQWREANPDIEPDFEGAGLLGFELEGADLMGANLKGAYLSRVNLRRAKLGAAILEKAYLIHADMEGADLKAARMANADLMGANLKRALLKRADLKAAFLYETNFQGAQLAGADFSGAFLSGADLRGADLRGANFQDADVTGVLYDDQARYQGIQVAGAFGGAGFRRFAQDQDYIEEFNEQHPVLGYLWWLCSNCGRSMRRWLALSLAVVWGFGVIYAGYDLPAAFPSWLSAGWEMIRPILTDGARTPFTPYYLSLNIFTTLGLGRVAPANLAAEIWIALEVAIAYLMWGGLVAILVFRFARRA